MSNQASLGDIKEPEEEKLKENPELIKGVAWSKIEGFPSDWNANTLEGDLDLQTGNNFPSENFVDEGGLPLIRIRDLPTGEPETNYKGAYDDEYLIGPEDLLVGMDGEFKPYLWSGNQALLNQRVLKIESEKYNKYFLRYSLEKPLRYIQKSISGTTVKHLSQKNIKKINLPTPEIAEQRRIASVLYNVDQAIQKTEEIIEQTQRVKKGLMQDLFTNGYFEHEEFKKLRIGPFNYKVPENWEVKTIKESKDGENGLRRGPFGGMLKKEIFVDSGYKVYQQQNVIYEDFDYGDYYITDEKFEEMERFSVEAGDLLISCSGTLGKVARVPENYKEGVINQALLKFSVDESLFSTAYMKYFLESIIGQRQLVMSSRGSALKNMAPMEFVRSSKIFRPPMKEQEKIADALLTLDNKIDSEKERKEQLRRLKKGLMQDLLTGEVRTSESVEVLDEVREVES